jgi:hypothetical protein
MTRDSAPTPTEPKRKASPAGRPSATERPEYMARTGPSRSRPDPSHMDEAGSEVEWPEYMVRTRSTRSWPSARDIGGTSSV